MSCNSGKDLIGMKVIRRSILHFQNSSSSFCCVKCWFQSYEDLNSSSDDEASPPQKMTAYENRVVKWCQVNSFSDNTQSSVSIIFVLFQLSLRTGKWHYICSCNRDKWITTEECVQLSNRDNVITGNIMIHVIFFSSCLEENKIKIYHGCS